MAIDQHAAHERVRLEAMLKGIVCTHHPQMLTMTTNTDLYDEQHKMRRRTVHPPFPLSLSQSQERLAHSSSAWLDSIGVKIEWRDGQVLATALPTIITSQNGSLCVAADLVQVIRCSVASVLSLLCHDTGTGAITVGGES